MGSVAGGRQAAEQGHCSMVLTSLLPLGRCGNALQEERLHSAAGGTLVSAPPQSGPAQPAQEVQGGQVRPHTRPYSHRHLLGWPLGTAMSLGAWGCGDPLGWELPWEGGIWGRWVRPCPSLTPVPI